jgi:1-deoxy-D-xylulose-5-phosphate reductoisomerase
VAAFLAGKTGFTAIPECIQEVLEAHPPERLTDIGHVLATDAWARRRAREALARRTVTRVS